MEEYNYDALASTIKIEDITSDEQNQDIIRQLKENDPNRDLVCICDEDDAWSENDYCPVEEEMGWLGYYIGKNTSLWRLGSTELMLSAIYLSAEALAATLQ